MEGQVLKSLKIQMRLFIKSPWSKSFPLLNIAFCGAFKGQPSARSGHAQPHNKILLLTSFKFQDATG